MGLLADAAAERTIDRDFDQTAVHVHAKDADCPTCAAVNNYHTPTKLFTGGKEIQLACDKCTVGVMDGDNPHLTGRCSCDCHTEPEHVNDLNATRIGNSFPAHLRKPFDRHVSPAVLEQRILDLDDRLRIATEHNDKLEDQLRVANERIKAFEKFTANLAAHIDGMQQAVEQAINPKPSFPRAA